MHILVISQCCSVQHMRIMKEMEGGGGGGREGSREGSREGEKCFNYTQPDKPKYIHRHINREMKKVSTYLCNQIKSHQFESEG